MQANRTFYDNQVIPYSPRYFPIPQVYSRLIPLFLYPPGFFQFYSRLFPLSPRIISGLFQVVSPIPQDNSRFIPGYFPYPPG